MRFDRSIRFAILAVVAAILVTPSAGRAGETAAPIGETTSDGGPVSEWMAWYYVFPAPERTGDFLVWLSNEKLLTGRPGAGDAMAAFLGPILRDHGEAIAATIDPAKLDEATRRATIRGFWYAGRTDLARRLFGELPPETATPAPDLARKRPATPTEVEEQWAAFMATGDRAYVHNVVDCLDESLALNDDRGVESRTRAAAANSLATYLLQHEKVLRDLEAEVKDRPTQVKKVATEIVGGAMRAIHPFPKTDGVFSAHLMISEPARLEKAAKAAGALDLTPVTRIGRDRKVVVKALFMGQELSETLDSDVTLDVTVTDPKGKPWSGPDLLGLEGFKGRVASRFRVFDSRGFATLWFTADDRPGVYTIRALVRDNVGKRSVAFEVPLEYVK